MNPLFSAILLCALLGAAFGNRMRCYDCGSGGGGGPSGSCQETVTTCREGKPQAQLGQTKLAGNRRCFLRGRRIHLDSLKSLLLCPRRQVLKPGVQHPRLILSLSLSDLDSSPSNLRGGPSLQPSANRAGGRRDLYDPQGLLRRGPVQQRYDEHLGPHVHCGRSSHRPGLDLARTVERV
uniref:Lymphocyte antigen 6 family member G6D n=1 Tax=Catagonus wagneri TaxID=51154 RepID=A0A8C3VT13_9CETA